MLKKFELKGNTVLIARVNLLMTFAEYLRESRKRNTIVKEYEKFTVINAWNTMILSMRIKS